MITATTNTAGTFTTPPSPGGCAIASGSEMPNVESRNSLKYWPQPIAMPATEMPYSMIRSQPMIQASSSPSVAYAYVYALPETGIDEASSAYASAENMQVTPASTNERTIDGPVLPIASPTITKMPVPMTAPIPSAVRSSSPTARFSALPRSSVSPTSCLGLLRANGPGREIVAMSGFSPAPASLSRLYAARRCASRSSDQ